MANEKILWSVIVPTAGRSASLRDAIISLCRQNLSANRYEILVVNNGEGDTETDATVNEISNLFPKHNIRLFHATPPGLLSGRHLGVQEAFAPILTFVDDDIIVAEDYAVNIIAAFKRERIHLVTGPSLPDYEDTPPYWLNQFWKSTNDSKECIYLSLMDFGNYEKLISPNYVWGLNFSIRKSTLFELGGFHPDNVPTRYQMFQGDGETGLTEKAQSKGFKALYVPGVKVWHKVSCERMTEFYFYKRQFYEGVCKSFTETRKAGNYILHFPLPIKCDPIDIADLPKRIYNGYVDGWFFHQMALRQYPELLEWVCKPDYWEYQYPNITFASPLKREWSQAILDNPLDVLNDPTLVLQLAINYGKIGMISEGIRATACVQRKYPNLKEVKDVMSQLLLQAGKVEDAKSLQ